MHLNENYDHGHCYYPQISRSEVDLPLRYPDSLFLGDYPPTIRVTVLPLLQDPQPTTCSLKVQGIAEDVEVLFHIIQQESREGKCLIVYLIVTTVESL